MTTSTILDSAVEHLDADDLARFIAVYDTFEVFAHRDHYPDACRRLAGHYTTTNRPALALAWLNVGELLRTRIDFHNLTSARE